MNNIVKQKWVAALRSGKYKQANGYLKDNGKYCCLGVLCELHRRETKGQWDDEKRRHPTYMGYVSILPTPVFKWAGLDSGNTNLHCGLSLVDLNDGDRDNKPATFKQIADIIESEL